MPVTRLLLRLQLCCCGSCCPDSFSSSSCFRSYSCCSYSYSSCSSCTAHVSAATPLPSPSCSSSSCTACQDMQGKCVPTPVCIYHVPCALLFLRHLLALFCINLISLPTLLCPNPSSHLVPLKSRRWKGDEREIPKP